MDKAKSKYTEDSTWTRINQELPEQEHEFQEPSDDEDADSQSRSFQPPGPDSMLIMTSKRNIHFIHQLHPTPHQILALWRKYLENVHPIIQLYTPEHKGGIIMRQLNNMDTIRLRTSLFLFTTYLTTVNSMTDEVCLQILGESRNSAMDKYQFAVEHLLAAVKIFRSSDFVALQSFLHYIFALRARADMNTVWTLTGIALRLGKRMGLHRDPLALGCGPWEAELRRRTWWHMQHLEHRAAQLSGGPATSAEEDWDTVLPLNIDDADLFPAMTELPRERVGSTDMMHVQCRFELVDFIRAFKRPDGRRWGFEWLMTLEVPIEEKDRAIDRLEDHMQAKYLQYCDALKPLHFLTTITIRAALNSIRLNAHHPRHQGGSLADFPQKERDLLFDLGMKSMQYDCLAHQQKIIAGFRWHFDAYFQWAGMILLLIELRARTAGPLVDRAWDTVQEVFALHPDFIADGRKSLHVAVQALVLKAWAAREHAAPLHPPFFAPPPTPAFIAAIRAQRDKAREARSLQRAKRPYPAPGDVDPRMRIPGCDDSPAPAYAPVAPAPPHPAPQRVGSTGALDDAISSGDSSLSFSPMDWAQWETLISEDMQQTWGPDMMDFAIGDVGLAGAGEGTGVLAAGADVNWQW